MLRGFTRSFRTLHTPVRALSASRGQNFKGKNTPGTGLDPSNIIHVLHDVQDILGASFNFSRIVMVGEQSAGKTSVLEAVIGADISHKAATMATRRPTLCTLIRTPPGTSMYAQFKDGEKLYSFEDVKNRIKADNAVPGVSEDPIQLTVYSPDVFDTVLIDLPGYIVSSEDGDADLPDQIAQLNQKFIDDGRNVLALCQSATQDPATSLAMSYAKRADRAGERTLGVVTKIDLVGDNKDFLFDMLQNKRYPLGLGRVGVRCRTHQEMLDNLSFPQLIEKEDSYLKANGFYDRDIRVGIPSLRQRLSEINIRAVSAEIPRILPELEQHIEKLKSNQGLIQRLMNEKDLSTVSRELHQMADSLHPASDSRRIMEEKIRERLHRVFNEALAQASAEKPFTHKHVEFSMRQSGNPEDAKQKQFLDAAANFMYKVDYDPKKTTVNLAKFRDLLIYGGQTHMDNIKKEMLTEFTRRLSLVTVASSHLTPVFPENPRKARGQWVRDLEIWLQHAIVEEGVVDLAFDAFMDVLTAAVADARGSAGAQPSPLAVAFFQFVLDKIARQKHESGLRHEVEGLIARERRPDIGLFALQRQIHLDTKLPEASGFFSNPDAQEVSVFGERWTEAYKRVMTERVSDDVFRIFNVRMVDPLLLDSITYTLGMFSSTASIKREAEKQGEEIRRLEHARDMLQEVARQYGHSLDHSKATTPAKSMKARRRERTVV